MIELITTKVIDVSFDYYNPNNQYTNFYLTSGTNGSGTYALCMVIGSVVQVMKPDKTMMNVKTGLSASKYHTLVAHVDVEKDIATFTIDGEDIKSNGQFVEFPFRNNITSIKGGFFGIGQSTGKTIEFDNFKAVRAYTGQIISNLTFEGEQTGGTPAGFTCTNKSASVSGNAVTVSFDFVNDGIHGGLCSLSSDGTSLPSFELSADGKTWHTATATISGDSLVLTCANVSAPTHVRFGYVAEPVKSLGTNSNGVKLPLAPFSEAIN